jgi:D-alanyl-D-alanine carboxypeptidase
VKRSVLAIALALSPAACSTLPAQSSTEQSAQAEIVRQASELMAQNYSADGPGAAILVARGDTVLFRAARGEANVETHTPLRPDSVFRIGSITKQFTAAGLLTLVEARRVNLDDPLSRYLPDYPNGENITLLQLLNHTSGVRNYSSLPGFVDGAIREDVTTTQIIATFKDEPPDFAPGAQWAYSNSGYVLIGAVIEAVTGMPWHAYLEQTFFEPLGMTHTGYGHDPRFARQLVSGYAYEGETLVPMRPMSMTQPHAAGALVSNVDDLLIWNRALHEGRVLRNPLYTQMITPAGPAAQSRYGFGIFTDTIRGLAGLGHGGHIFGFMSELSYLPGEDITIVVLENDDARNGIEQADQIGRRLTAIALGAPYPSRTPVPLDMADLQASEGVYRFPDGAVRTLRIINGALTAQRDRGRQAVLTPIGAGDFLYDDGFNRITLERNTQGDIIAARFFANGEGDGVVGERSTLPPPPLGLDLPRAALERLTGDYANSELALRVYLDDAGLWAQIDGQEAFNLQAVSMTTFNVGNGEASLEFSPGDAPAAELIVRQGGRETRLLRR